VTGLLPRSLRRRTSARANSQRGQYTSRTGLRNGGRVGTGRRCHCSTHWVGLTKTLGRFAPRPAHKGSKGTIHLAAHWYHSPSVGASYRHATARLRLVVRDLRVHDSFENLRSTPSRLRSHMRRRSADTFGHLLPVGRMCWKII